VDQAAINADFDFLRYATKPLSDCRQISATPTTALLQIFLTLLGMRPTAQDFFIV
jgi:hypothetical protein